MATLHREPADEHKPVAISFAINTAA